MTNRKPRMKLHVTNWLTQTAHLDGIQYTVLHLLLNHACMSGGDLPDDRESLARLARCTIEEFEQAWPAIEEWFDVAPDGRLTAPDACDGVIAAQRARR